MRTLILTILTSVLLAGCATDNARIDTAVTKCCGAGETRTFQVVTRNVPAFLGPLMVSNFSVAFANIGMQPVESGADLMVELRYEQSNLSPDRAHDDFEERIATGDAMRFIARVVIEVRDAKTRQLVWSGHVQRLHDVGPGDYMHTGRASIAIYDAFTKVLKDYSG